MVIDTKKTAIWTVEREIPYAELLSRITDFASLCPTAAGARVVIFSENRPAYAYATFGIWQNSGIVVPVDASSTAAELAYVLKDCTPEAIWVSEALEATAREAVQLAGGNQKVCVITKQTEDAPTNSAFGELDLHKKDKDEVGLIVYTSGTTGSPKGVMLTFDNLLANIDSVSREVPIFHADLCTMVLLPLHHILPIMGSIVAPFTTGGSIAICPSMSAPDLMKTLKEAKVGCVIGVPRLYTMLTKGIKAKIDAKFLTRTLYNLCKAIGSRRLSGIIFSSIKKMMGGHIKYFVSGGAALDPAVATIMKTLALDVLEGYGMTECAPMISFTRPDDIVPGASGQPLSCCTVKIIDGEVCVRGRNVMKGYYGRPQETADVLDSDGWLHTGDLGHFDDHNRLIITGRRKEIIVLSNGKNVNPVDIEQEIESFDTLVKEAAVTEKDDALVAIIVPTAQLRTLSDAEIVEKIKWEVLEKYNAEAPGYKKIFNVKIYHGDLPRTRLDKLQRYKLKALIAENSAQEEEPTIPEDALSQEYKILRKYIETEKKCKVRPTDHIELDLGFDSLDKVGLQVFINDSFGLDVTTDKITSFRTIQDLADFVAESKTKMQVEKIDWKKILREHTELKLPQTWVTGRIIIALARPFFHLYFKLTGKGMNEMPEGPVIIAPNHQSYLDGLFVMSFLKFRDIKNTYFYAKEQHVKRPFTKFMAATHNVIVMDMSNLKDSIQKLGEALKKNKNLIIFPEGTRTKDGSMGEFKKTFAILSKELDVPVVPVSIKGAYEAMPKGTILPRPHKVEVEFLSPIYPTQDSSYEGLTDETYESIKKNQENQEAA